MPNQELVREGPVALAARRLAMLAERGDLDPNELLREIESTIVRLRIQAWRTQRSRWGSGEMELMRRDA